MASGLERRQSAMNDGSLKSVCSGRWLIRGAKAFAVLVPGGGVEPPRCQAPADFESAASASSAIPAKGGNFTSPRLKDDSSFRKLLTASRAPQLLCGICFPPQPRVCQPRLMPPLLLPAHLV